MSEDNTAEKATRVEKTMLSIMDAPRALANALVPGVDLGLSRGEGALSLAFAHLAQSAIEDVYADCGDSDARVLASNVGQRIAWNVDEVLFSGPEPTEYHAGFDAGRASRDSEVAVLRERVAELEAVVEKVRYEMQPGRLGPENESVEVEVGTPAERAIEAVAERTKRIRSILATPPSEVLAAVRREAAAEALERAAARFAEGDWNDAFIVGNVDDDVSAVQATEAWFKARAAEIRAGGNR